MKRILVILGGGGGGVSLIVLMMIFTGCGGAPGVPVNILPAAFNLTAPLSSEQGNSSGIKLGSLITGRCLRY